MYLDTLISSCDVPCVETTVGPLNTKKVLGYAMKASRVLHGVPGKK